MTDTASTGAPERPAGGRWPRGVRTGVVVAVVVIGTAALLAAVPSVHDRILTPARRPVVATATAGPEPVVVVAGPGATLRRIDPATGEVLGSVPTPGEVVRALTVVTVDGRDRIATGDEDGTVRMRDLETGEPVGGPLGHHNGPVTSLVPTRLPYEGVTVDRPEPYDGGPGLGSGGEDGTVRLWDAAAGTRWGSPDGPQADGPLTGPVRAIAAETSAVERTYGAYNESLGVEVTTTLVPGTADGLVGSGSAYGAEQPGDGGRPAGASGGVTAIAVVHPPAGAFPTYGDPRSLLLFAVGYGDGSIRVLTELSYSEQLPMSIRRDVARGPVTSLQSVALPGGDAVVAGFGNGTLLRMGPTLAEGPVATTTLPATARGGYAVASTVVGGRLVVVAAFGDGTVTRWAPDG